MFEHGKVEENLLLLQPHFLKQKEYWLGKLSGDMDKTEIFTLHKIVDTLPIQWLEVPVDFSPELSRKLMKLGKGTELTAYVILLAALKILIYRYERQTDVTVISPVYLPAVTNETINRIVFLRDTIDPGLSFKQTLMQVRQTLLEAYGNQDYPSERLIRYIFDKEETLKSHPFSDILCRLSAIHDLPEYKHDRNDSRERISFHFEMTDGQFSGKIVFDNRTYSPFLLTQMAGHLTELLDHALDDVELPITAIPYIPESERRMLVEEFNRNKTQYPSDKTFRQLFEDQVEKTPDNFAVRCGDTRLTYRQLNERANRLAGFLIEKGLQRDEGVAVLMDRSIDMIEGILAVWKAGGAYIPIDTSYPDERIRYMLETSQSRVVLTDTHSFARHSYTALEGLQLSDIEVCTTAPRPSISDLDSHPIPDRSLVDYEKYNRLIGHAIVANTITIQATRGCPYRCAYCLKVWPKHHFVRSAQHIFDEIKIYYDMGFRRFVLIDDVFNLNKRNSTRFFQLIIESGLNKDIRFFFPNGLRGDILTHEFIDLMVKAGTVSISMALETASPRLQKLIRKNLNIEKFRENLEYICKTYPHVYLELFTMHGFPTETEEEALSTLEFIKSIKWVDFPYLNILTIYTNTEMEKIALENGISQESIFNSEDLAEHEFLDTLPFDKSFTLKYQTDFLNDYFLLKERLLAVLPRQMKLLTESELVQKYNSFFPNEIKSFPELLQFLGITREELEPIKFVDEESTVIHDVNEKMRRQFPAVAPKPGALRILLLDLSQYFDSARDTQYYVCEPPLGLMYLLTGLKHKFGPAVHGKIAKAHMDFDNFDQLKEIIAEFKPDVIGMRTLTYYRDFFHETAGLIRQWGFKGALISGGPYPMSNYKKILKDRHIDLTVLGEGEATLCHLIEKMLENSNQLPPGDVLKTIPGIAFIPPEEKTKKEFAREVVLVDEIRGSLEAYSPADPPGTGRVSDLAYMIYTSGSTGKPKAAMVEQAGMVNHMYAKIHDLHIDEFSIIAQNSSHTFDISVWQFFAALVCGGKTIIYPNDIVLDPHAFITRIIDDRVTILEVVPSYLLAVLDFLDAHPMEFRNLKWLLVTGEAVKQSLVRRWFKMAPQIKMVNAYGPTEASDDITHYIMDKAPDLERIPIGKPIQNLNIYIVDNNMNLCPTGIQGEIVVSGIGVGRGYFQDRHRTRESFIIDPFQPGQGIRMYKTGDLGCWLPNGSIDFFGRKDYQVKIRGYRIELGEIESKIDAHPEVKEVVVLDREDTHGNKYLCAYVELAHPVDESEFKRFLSKRLPDYMIPSFFIALDTMPLTPNGKIDRSALLKIDTGEASSTYVAPRSELEENMARIWAEVLGIDKIGINDNFFEFGGDSIKAIQLSARIQKFGLKVKIGDLFMNPTIAELVGYVRHSGRQVNQEPVTGEVPLSPIQHSFFKTPHTDFNHYNQAVMLYSPNGFDSDITTAVFKELVRHHDMLRAVYRFDFDFPSSPAQELTPAEKQGETQTQTQFQVPSRVTQELKGIDDAGLFEFNTADLSHLNDNNQTREHIEDHADRVHRTMDLTRGPLVKVVLFKTNHGDHLLVIIHHLVIEGVSWRILFEDFQTAYRRLMNKEALSLPPRTDSFKHWIESLQKYASGPKMIKEVEYWSKIDQTPVDPLPRDYHASPEKRKNKYRQILSMSLDETETASLLKEVNHAYNTEIPEILTTALGLALKDWRGMKQIPMILEGHGREDIIDDDDIDLSRTIGWMASEYPVIIDMSRSADISHHIKSVKETFRHIPHKGVGYGILKYLTPAEKKTGLAFQLNPEICFNYIGQVDQRKSSSHDAAADLFSLSPFKTGDNMSPESEFPFAIGIDGNITDGKLNLAFDYNTNEFRADSIEKLVQIYAAHLKTIIRHCKQKDEKEATPSDFTYSNLSIDELRNMETDLDDIE